MKKNSEYVIVGIRTEPLNEPSSHDHIVEIKVRKMDAFDRVFDEGGWSEALSVGSTSFSATERMGLGTVLASIDTGMKFCTIGPRSKKVAKVQAIACGHCHHRIIKSEPDCTEDNNLDSLPHFA